MNSKISKSGKEHEKGPLHNFAQGLHVDGKNAVTTGSEDAGSALLARQVQKLRMRFGWSPERALVVAHLAFGEPAHG